MPGGRWTLQFTNRGSEGLLRRDRLLGQRPRPRGRRPGGRSVTILSAPRTAAGRGSGFRPIGCRPRWPATEPSPRAARAWSPPGGRDAWFGDGRRREGPGVPHARSRRDMDRGRHAASPPGTRRPASSRWRSPTSTDGIAVGGDYRQEQATGRQHRSSPTDGGATWTFAGRHAPRSFRSAVAYVPGSHGQDASWRSAPAGPTARTTTAAPGSRFGNEGFHALSVEPGGHVAWAVGEGGRIGRMTIKK